MYLNLGKNLEEVKNFLSEIKQLWDKTESLFENEPHKFAGDIRELKAFLKNEFQRYEDARKSGTPPEKSGLEGAPLLYAVITDDKESIDYLLKLIEGEEAFVVKIGADGAVWGTGTYEQLDYRWSFAVINLLENIFNGNYNDKEFPKHSPSYKSTSISNRCKIAVIGDWGAGYNWLSSPPNKDVANSVNKMSPDIVIHLGDVYYAGTSEEEMNNLVNIFPKGSHGTYALNSNHEMYSIAIPYFKAVSEPPFGYQDNTSYFALENDNWIIACLDTAFFAPVEKMFLTGSLGKDSVQIPFFKGLINKAKTENKDIIIMTHHNGMEGKGISDSTEIWDEITSILKEENFEGRVFWEWGHAHCAYTCNPINNIFGRCIGHGAIPWGKGSDFYIGKGSNLNWFEDKTQKEEDSTLLMNGFMILELDGTKITETFYDQRGNKSITLINGK